LLKKMITLSMVGHYALLNGMAVAAVREGMLNGTWKSRSLCPFLYPAMAESPEHW